MTNSNIKEAEITYKDFIRSNHTMYKTSDEGIDFIKRHEGLKLKKYKDAKGLWTIGYGHLITKEDGDLKEITLDEAEYFLLKDLSIAEDAVNKANLTLTQQQFDALVSLVFNIGITAFNKSELLEALKKDDIKQAKIEWAEWIGKKNKPIKGLVYRRNAEINLFDNGVYEEV